MLDQSAARRGHPASLLEPALRPHVANDVGIRQQGVRRARPRAGQPGVWLSRDNDIGGPPRSRPLRPAGRTGFMVKSTEEDLTHGREKNRSNSTQPTAHASWKPSDAARRAATCCACSSRWASWPLPRHASFDGRQRPRPDAEEGRAHPRGDRVELTADRSIQPGRANATDYTRPHALQRAHAARRSLSPQPALAEEIRNGQGDRLDLQAAARREVSRRFAPYARGRGVLLSRHRTLRPGSKVRPSPNQFRRGEGERPEEVQGPSPARTRTCRSSWPQRTFQS